MTQKRDEKFIRGVGWRSREHTGTALHCNKKNSSHTSHPQCRCHRFLLIASHYVSLCAHCESCWLCFHLVPWHGSSVFAKTLPCLFECPWGLTYKSREVITAKSWKGKMHHVLVSDKPLQACLSSYAKKKNLCFSQVQKLFFS